MTRLKFFLIICIFFDLPSLWQKWEYFVPQFSLILLPLSWRHNDTHKYACRKLQNWRTHKIQFCFDLLLRKHTTHFVKDLISRKIFFNHRFTGCSAEIFTLFTILNLLEKSFRIEKNLFSIKVRYISWLLRAQISVLKNESFAAESIFRQVCLELHRLV